MSLLDTTARLLLAGILGLLLSGTSRGAERIWRDQAGLIRVEPPPVPPELINPWPEAWEEGFRRRADLAIQSFAEAKLTGATVGDSEKDSYARAMFAFLAGRRPEALKILQAEDVQAQAENRHTLGIDFYGSLTLNQQIRKAFYFGNWLAPDYRERMERGARIWSAEDPLGRPHPLHGRGDSRRTGWGPDARGSWTDVRDTDDLRNLRDVAIYLFAEASGNDATRRVARDRLIAWVRMLYHVGMREWDSPSRHGQSLTAWHNLFDFARDPEMRLLAKAALDWLYAAAALKYDRGGFSGPGLRDPGGIGVALGGSAAHTLELMFGMSPVADTAPDRDELHLITSAYRPPAAVVRLARREFARPVEILSTKPGYELWRTNRPYAPRYWETLFLAKTYQMGSVVSSSPEEAWNPTVFQLMARNSSRGVDYLGLNTTPLWEPSVKRAGDQIGQHRNLVIWLRPSQPTEPFHLQLPRGLDPLVVSNVCFLTFERTWVALWPLNLTNWVEVTTKTREQAASTERFFEARPTGGSFCGLALEVGDDGSFSHFQRQVLEQSELDLSSLETGTVALKGSDGTRLELRHNPRSDLPFVKRNGKVHEWQVQSGVYAPTSGRVPISQRWLSGTLRVEAGGELFQQTVTLDGAVRR